MKSFFKMLLASILGVLAASILFFFITIGVLGSMAGSLTTTSSSTPATVSPRSILRIMLDNPMEDRGSPALMPNITNSSFSLRTSIGLNDILKSLKNAVTDPNITLVYLDLSNLSIGMAQLEEIRMALLDFKESGKPIIAYADNYSQGAYYLASVADKVYLNPFGSALLQGMSAEVMFYKKALEKLQVDMQIIRHGKFKSAVEPFMLDKLSPENRTQILSFAGSIWRHLLEQIAQARRINVDELQSFADNLSLASAQDALNNQLIDGLFYKDELLQELCKLSGVETEQELTMIDIEKYANTVKPGKFSKDKIAVVYASGDIIMGKGRSDITAWEYANTFRRIRSDSTIKAVVFRVNSPGGDAQASEIIARELSLIKKVKPVVISMSNYAASGGYWIAAPSNIIITNPTTLTGSIGVFGMIPNLEKGLGNILGLTVDVVKTAQSADFPSVYRPLTEQEKNVLQGRIENIYTKFIELIATNRPLSAQQIDSIGQGRVWCGIDAVKLGLADRLGGLTQAIDAAADLAGVENYRIVELPTVQSPFEQLMQTLGGKTKAALPKQLEDVQKLLNEVGQARILARLPYDIILH